MDVKHKDLKKIILKTKDWVEQVKGKIKVCENCKDKKEAKKCIVSVLDKA